MPSFLNKLKENIASSSSSSSLPSQKVGQYSHYGVGDAPPAWAPAPESSYEYGRFNEASAKDHQDAENYCKYWPIYQPRPVPSVALDRIKEEGAVAWGIDSPSPTTRFRGKIENIPYQSKGSHVVKVHTEKNCREACLSSTLPIIAGMYETRGREGVYYEIKVHKMDGIIALGTVVLPYPEWRFPGWNRLSAGLHLDDMRKFFEDATGGRDYTPMLTRVREGDVFGCGYEFSTSSIFFTYNGNRLPNAFSGVYLPRTNYDVMAGIGVEGHCKFEVNFGGDLFMWVPGNEWHWKVDGMTARFAETNNFGDELPAYSSSA